VQSHAIRGKERWNCNDIGRCIIMSPHRRQLELHDCTPPKKFSGASELTELFMEKAPAKAGAVLPVKDRSGKP